MSKKILAIYYTQSGQLGEIVDNFTSVFTAAGMSVEKVNVAPQPGFAFPWNGKRFFDAMPESVLGIPSQLAPFELKEDSYDLIIFAYQPWFLAPSIPANTILNHPSFKAVVKNTPVITIIGARNMWLKAQERVKKMLADCGAKLVGNIALVDRNANLTSGVTILYWMMTGKKDKMWGIFPKPGVADEDIENVKMFGNTALQYLNNGNWAALQPALIEQKALEVKSNLMFIEPRATKLFSIWANVIIKKKNRSAWLVVFKYYLLIALFIIAPIVLIINTIFFKPFLGNSIKRKKQYYLAVN
ncbi:MAG: hypothetical protein QM726_25735 [Chitinophagaceae bacterium]